MAHETHACFFKRAIGLAAIAAQTRSDAVLPRCGTTARPWHDMIDGQSVETRRVAAVLAAEAIATHDVAPRVGNGHARHAFVVAQDDGLRHGQRETDRLDAWSPGRARRQPVFPSGQRVRLGIHRACSTTSHQNERTPYRRGGDRQPGTIQDEGGAIQHGRARHATRTGGRRPRPWASRRAPDGLVGARERGAAKPTGAGHCIFTQCFPTPRAANTGAWSPSPIAGRRCTPPEPREVGRSNLGEGGFQ